jgi:hypothetical protein
MTDPANDQHAAPAVLALSDLGNAERMVRQHRGDLRYCHPWGKWLVWNGERWKIDDTAEVVRRAKKVARAIPREADTVDDYETRKAILKHAAKIGVRAALLERLPPRRSARLPGLPSFGVPVAARDRQRSRVSAPRPHPPPAADPRWPREPYDKAAADVVAHLRASAPRRIGG